MNGSARLAAGSRAARRRTGSSRASCTGARGSVADGRVAADPQPGHDRRELGTASPAGDALPPLLVERAEVELASIRALAASLADFLVGPKRNALADDELIVAVEVIRVASPRRS